MDGQPTLQRNQADELEIARLLFDPTHYVNTYRTALENQDPFDHYMRDGWRIGFNPNPYFDTAHYLAANPDVAAAGVNPLWHFAVTGAAEKRSSVRRAPKPLRSVALAAQPPSERARHYGAVADRRDPIGPDALEVMLARAQAEAGSGLVISASHDRYRQVTGGVQSLIVDEEVALRAQGVSYLHLAPASPVPLLAAPDACTFTLTLNARDAGVMKLEGLLEVLRRTERRWPFRRLVVHHFMGHSPESLAAVAAAVGPESPIVWTHDFFTLCPSYALLRNDIVFCDGPHPASSACNVCVYSTDRQTHLRRISDFFAVLKPHIVAPSASALEFWRSRAPYMHASAQVVPLGKLEPGEARPAPLVRRADGTLRVAFIGVPTTHKGWHVFEALAHRHFDDPRYRFFAFGAWSEGGRGIQHVRVQVGPDSRDAMVEALEEHGIDVVVNWTLCHETFSFTTLEALAAGCFLVVRPRAGNVWPQVSALGPRHGVALESELELRALFVSGALIEAAQQERAGGRILRSSGSADLLRQVAA